MRRVIAIFRPTPQAYVKGDKAGNARNSKMVEDMKQFKDHIKKMLTEITDTSVKTQGERRIRMHQTTLILHAASRSDAEHHEVRAQPEPPGRLRDGPQRSAAAGRRHRGESSLPPNC